MSISPFLQHEPPSDIAQPGREGLIQGEETDITEDQPKYQPRTLMTARSQNDSGSHGLELYNIKAEGDIFQPNHRKIPSTSSDVQDMNSYRSNDASGSSISLESVTSTVPSPLGKLAGDPGDLPREPHIAQTSTPRNMHLMESSPVFGLNDFAMPPSSRIDFLDTNYAPSNSDLLGPLRFGGAIGEVLNEIGMSEGFKDMNDREDDMFSFPYDESNRAVSFIKQEPDYTLNEAFQHASDTFEEGPQSSDHAFDSNAASMSASSHTLTEAYAFRDRPPPGCASLDNRERMNMVSVPGQLSPHLQGPNAIPGHHQSQRHIGQQYQQQQQWYQLQYKQQYKQNEEVTDQLSAGGKPARQHSVVNRVPAPGRNQPPVQSQPATQGQKLPSANGPDASHQRGLGISYNSMSPANPHMSDATGFEPEGARQHIPVAGPLHTSFTSPAGQAGTWTRNRFVSKSLPVNNLRISGLPRAIKTEMVPRKRPLGFPGADATAFYRNSFTSASRSGSIDFGDDMSDFRGYPSFITRKSKSKLPLAQLYKMMGLGNDHVEGKRREELVMSILRREGFVVGRMTLHRDIQEDERNRLLNVIVEETKEWGYDEHLTKVIIHRGVYSRMQSYLRKRRRKYRKAGLSPDSHQLSDPEDLRGFNDDDNELSS